MSDTAVQQKLSLTANFSTRQCELLKYGLRSASTCTTTFATYTVLRAALRIESIS